MVAENLWINKLCFGHVHECQGECAHMHTEHTCRDVHAHMMTRLCMWTDMHTHTQTHKHTMNTSLKNKSDVKYKKIKIWV